MAIKTYQKGSREQLSKNFQAFEFDCGCTECKETLIDEKLVQYLQQIRDHFGKPIGGSRLTAYRCPEHNAQVPNAAKNSRHTMGMAADISIAGVLPAEIAKYAESIGILGIGLYDTEQDGHFVHIDTRTVKSFWKGHAQQRVTTFGRAAEQRVQISLPLLRKGDSGQSVKALQTLLGVEADGLFGGKTHAALGAFQGNNGLEADSIAGIATWSKLLGVE